MARATFDRAARPQPKPAKRATFGGVRAGARGATTRPATPAPGTRRGSFGQQAQIAPPRTAMRTMPDRAVDPAYSREAARRAVLMEAQRLQREAMARQQAYRPTYGSAWTPPGTQAQTAQAAAQAAYAAQMRATQASAARPAQQPAQQRARFNPMMTEQQWVDYYRSQGYGYGPYSPIPDWPGHNQANLQPVGQEWIDQSNYATVPYYASQVPTGNMDMPGADTGAGGGGGYDDWGSWDGGGWGGGGGGGYTEPPPEWWERMTAWTIR